MTAGSRKCGDPILLPLEVDWTPHFRPWGMGRIAFVPPPMEPPAVQFSGGKGEGGGVVNPSVVSAAVGTMAAGGTRMTADVDGECRGHPPGCLAHHHQRGEKEKTKGDEENAKFAKEYRGKVEGELQRFATPSWPSWTAISS